MIIAACVLSVSSCWDKVTEALLCRDAPNTVPQGQEAILIFPLYSPCFGLGSQSLCVAVIFHATQTLQLHNRIREAWAALKTRKLLLTALRPIIKL